MSKCHLFLISYLSNSGLPAAAEAGFKLTDGRGFYLNSQDGDRFLRIPFCSLTPEEIRNAMQSLTKIIVH